MYLTKEQGIHKQSTKVKFTRIGPAANSMARLWQKTKQQSFNAGQSVRHVLSTPLTRTEQDLNLGISVSNPVNKPKYSRSWPIFHHSPPYSMSHYHVPKTSTRSRSFCSNSGGGNITLKEAEWAMMSGSFPSERQMKEFLEVIKSRNGTCENNIAKDRATRTVAKMLTSTIRRSSQQAH